MKKKRFVRTYRQDTLHTFTEIWIDRETGINYIFHNTSGEGGITPLLGADGKPVVTPKSQIPED